MATDTWLEESPGELVGWGVGGGGDRTSQEQLQAEPTAVPLGHLWAESEEERRVWVGVGQALVLEWGGMYSRDAARA